MTQVSQSTKDAYKLHLIMLLKLSWPNFLTSLIQLGLPVTSTIAVGHIIGESETQDSKLIGAAALGNMFANASGFAIGSGLAMALDTLCSQAFGAKKFKLVGLHCQRAMVILTLACIPIALVWYNAWVILQYIGQDPAIAILSQFWIHRLLPALWPRIMYETYRRYLLSQRVMWPLTVSVAITVPVHVLMTYTLVFTLGWGFAGAAWAMSFSYWFLFLTVLSVSNLRLYVLRRKERRERGERQGGNRYAKGFMIEEKESKSEEKENEDEGEREKRESASSLLSASLGSSVGLMENEEREEEEEREERERNGDPLHTWPAWSKDVFRGWISFFKLGIATALSLFIEWGSFEVNAAIAAYLGEVPLAAHAIMCNSVSVWYAFPLGVATATTALVGNMLGAGEPDRAKIAARIGMVIALIYGIFNGAFGLLYRDFLGMVFTSDEAVVKAISNVMFVMWLYGLVDAMKAVGTAILRGSGRPKLTVYGNILSCIFIGYPVALAMVFKGGFGLGGIWFGMSTAWMCAATIFTIIISKTNWQLEVLNAAKRNSEAEKSTEKGKERMKEGLLMSVVVKDEEKEKREEEDDEDDDNINEKKNGYNAVSVNG